MCLIASFHGLAFAKASGTRAVNIAFGVMYRSGYWIKKQVGHRLSKYLFLFLSMYARAAQITLNQHKRRFPMTPKIHMLAHSAYSLRSQSHIPGAQWVCNPLAESNQIQEDFIGRPSRLSRRVGVRQVHTSTMYRALILYMNGLRASDADPRSMDSFPDLFPGV